LVLPDIRPPTSALYLLTPHFLPDIRRPTSAYCLLLTFFPISDV
jgi:hypothetical protein